MASPHSPIIDLSEYIEIRDDRAHLRGRRLPVIFVASLARDRELTVDQLAYEFTLTREQVLAALLYYREHQAQIDAADALDATESRRLHDRYGGQPGARKHKP